MDESPVNVASKLLFRLSVRHVGRMGTQVRLLNLLVRLAGWVNSELVGSKRNTDRMMLSSNTMPSKMSYLLFISSPCQNRRMLEEIARNHSPCQNRRSFEKKNNNFSCHVLFIVNQICYFASTMKTKPQGRAVARKKFWLRQTLPWPATGIQRNNMSSKCAKPIFIITIELEPSIQRGFMEYSSIRHAKMDQIQAAILIMWDILFVSDQHSRKRGTL